MRSSPICGKGNSLGNEVGFFCKTYVHIGIIYTTKSCKSCYLFLCQNFHSTCYIPFSPLKSTVYSLPFCSNSPKKHLLTMQKYSIFLKTACACTHFVLNQTKKFKNCTGYDTLMQRRTQSFKQDILKGGSIDGGSLQESAFDVSKK